MAKRNRRKEKQLSIKHYAQKMKMTNSAERSPAPEVLSFAVPLATFVVLIMLKSGNKSLMRQGRVVLTAISGT